MSFPFDGEVLPQDALLRFRSCDYVGWSERNRCRRHDRDLGKWLTLTEGTEAAQERVVALSSVKWERRGKEPLDDSYARFRRWAQRRVWWTLLIRADMSNRNPSYPWNESPYIQLIKSSRRNN